MADSEYPAMKPEVKALWLQALLSGAYEQGKDYLRGKDGYCCLGVLCDVSPLGEWSDPRPSGVLAFDRHIHLTPESVQEWAGLTDSAASELAVLNDHARYSFEQIAKWIDDNL